MSVPFEIHILCMQSVRTGTIDYQDIKLHFQISTDPQQRFYYIAITEEYKNGSFKARHDLGQFIRTGWESVLRLIPKIPEIYKASKPISKTELDKPNLELLQELDQLISLYRIGLDELYRIRSKYFPNT